MSRFLLVVAFVCIIKYSKEEKELKVFCEQSGWKCQSGILILVCLLLHPVCKTWFTWDRRVHGAWLLLSCVTCRYSTVSQVLSTLLQATCRRAMRLTSPLLAGPSPYGASSTPGSASWSFIPPPTFSEGTAHQQPSVAFTVNSEQTWANWGHVAPEPSGPVKYVI